MARKPDIPKLKEQANRYLGKGKHEKALETYLQLEEADPAEGGWARRSGEMLRHIGDKKGAVAAFERAVDRYAGRGFVVKAVAVCKMILRLEPDNSSARERLLELNSERGIIERQPPAARPPVPPVPAPEPVELAPGAPLDSIQLGSVVPGSKPVPGAGGMPSGIMEIPIELEIDMDEAMEIVQQGHNRAAAEIREALAETPLFSQLPAEALGRLIDDVELVELPAGQTLFRQGDAGDTLYVVAEGEVAVTVESPQSAELARLEEGAFFGEIALVHEQPRSATITAVENSELLAINREVMRQLLQHEPGVLKVLLRFLRDRLIDNLVATSPLFAPYLEEDRRRLSARFQLIEADEGAVLITEGTMADGLYITLSGSLDVSRAGVGSIATLAPGDLFGEMSLLAQAGAVATVRATSRVLALRLRSSDFREVIMTHPQVLAFVGELAEERERQMAAVAGGEEDYVELHLELV